MPPQEDIEKFNQAYKIFEETGAIKTGPGHFVYTSGDHGVIYIEKDEIFSCSMKSSDLCKQIAEHFKNSDIDAIAGPESGGTIMANLTAMQLCRLRGVEYINVVHLFKKGPFIITKQEEEMVGKKILLVDDIATTGGTLKKCAQTICDAGGLIAGIGLLWFRGDIFKVARMFQGSDIFPLIRVRLEGWSEEQCRLTGPCSKKVPINIEHGHGAEFLKKYPEFKAVTDVPFIASNINPK